MPDERLEALKEAERAIAVMRRNGMKVGRIVDENDLPNLLWHTMLVVDQIEDLDRRLKQAEEPIHRRNEAEDLDVHRERRAELRAVKDDEDSEREEARKVGRETL